jgi:hypothetical protein
METFDSQGRILPIGAADQGIVSKKVADKNGQGQGPQPQPRKKAAPAQPPEEKAEETLREDHAIDILV